MTFQAPKDDWFKPKTYLHFDVPVRDEQRSYIERIVTDKNKVAQHSFYPFITYKVTKYKMGTDPVSGNRFLDSSGERPLSYAAHLDSQIYSYYSKELTKLYEQKLLDNGISENVIAFRKLIDPISNDSKCNIHLANDAFEKIKSIGECDVIAVDIKSFFDKLNHDYLKKCWLDLIEEKRLPDDHFALYKSLTSHAIVFRKEVYKLFNIPKKNPKSKGFFRICSPEDFRRKVRGDSVEKKGNKIIRRGLINLRDKGIPQGSPISALLANIYMFDFDKILNHKVDSLKGAYFRYCDDIFCIIPKGSDFDIESFISTELDKIHLYLNDKKTERSIFSYNRGELISDKPIQYLGFMFDGKRKYIRASSIASYRRKARKAIRLAKSTMCKYNKKREEKGLETRKLYRRKLFKNYFHSGKTNFISYGHRASKTMNSNEIRKQIKKLCNYIIFEIG
jgi:hypothetical protein